MSNQNRLSFINSMLTRLGNLRLLNLPHASGHTFELYCYFQKIEQFTNRGKTPRCNNPVHGVFFVPHVKPGSPRSTSYFSLVDSAGGETVDLILNGKFAGVSEIRHSPDIVLTAEGSDDIKAIYECKSYSGSLGIGVYREFIGFCQEMGLLRKANRDRVRAVTDPYPEMRSCIYTSAVANPAHVQGIGIYDFAVVDRF